MGLSRYARLYDSLYENGSLGARPSTGEVIHALRILTPENDARQVTLLGAHGNRTGHADAFPAEMRSALAEAIRGAVNSQPGQAAGFGAYLQGLLVHVLDTHRSIRKLLLTRYTTHRKVDRFKRLFHRPRITVTPLPLRPSKRDLVLLAAGVAPFHYHNTTARPTTEDAGLAVYLDVSGSVNQHLPEIIGLLRHLKEDLRTIYLFSNQVAEVPFKDLLKGQVKTTYGTDFDCIEASSAMRRCPRRNDGSPPGERHERSTS